MHLETCIAASVLPLRDSSATHQPLACRRLIPAACSCCSQIDCCLQDYYSIEHNGSWFEQIQAKLEKDNAAQNVHMLLVCVPKDCLARMQPC